MIATVSLFECKKGHSYANIWFIFYIEQVVEYLREEKNQIQYSKLGHVI